MKNRMVLLALLVTILFTGCSSPNWKATIQTNTEFKNEQPTLLTVIIKENGKPVTGLKVHALLEMKKMDHGTVEVDLIESKNGTYEGSPQLPMSGEWNAILEMSNGKKTQEETITFEVK